MSLENKELDDVLHYLRILFFELLIPILILIFYDHFQMNGIIAEISEWFASVFYKSDPLDSPFKKILKDLLSLVVKILLVFIWAVIPALKKVFFKKKTFSFLDLLLSLVIDSMICLFALEMYYAFIEVSSIGQLWVIILEPLFIAGEIVLFIDFENIFVSNYLRKNKSVIVTLHKCLPYIKDRHDIVRFLQLRKAMIHFLDFRGKLTKRIVIAFVIIFLFLWGIFTGAFVLLGNGLKVVYSMLAFSSIIITFVDSFYRLSDENDYDLYEEVKDKIKEL